MQLTNLLNLKNNIKNESSEREKINDNDEHTNEENNRDDENIDDNIIVDINFDENNSILNENNNDISNGLEYKTSSLFERLLLNKKFIDYKDLINDIKTKKINYKRINIDSDGEDLLNVLDFDKKEKFIYLKN